MNTSHLSSNQSLYQTDKSWTDDLPVCKQSGVGFSTNQIYREDGHPQEEHPFENRSCHCRFDDNSFLYAVFDGHEGVKCVDFCIQRMLAEILLGQLTEKKTDEEIKEVLRQAFVSVEKGYLDTICDLLAERASFQYDIPEGLNPYEVYQKVPHIVEKIKMINMELSSGTAGAIVLVYNTKLYVANVGNCRVLLCRADINGVLKVIQLSTDHDLRNEDELLRLSQIGLNIEMLRKCSHLGNQENTRCLGNYLVKGGYKEFEDLHVATQEPIISEPDIMGGYQLDETCQFLLVMSAGLYRSIEEATRTEQVNKYVAELVVEQFREQATLTGVAQAVVDRAVRLHHDWYMSNSLSAASTKREDITLIVRNFNFPMPNAIKSPTNPSVIFNSEVSSSNTLTEPTDATDFDYNSIRTNTSNNAETKNDRLADKKIDAYVDFSDYYRNVEIARKNGTLPNGIDF